MAQQPLIFMLNNKVNKELKHTENDSDMGQTGCLIGAMIVIDSYKYLKKPQNFSEKLPSCLQLHPVLGSLEHLAGPTKSQGMTIHSETVSGIIF